MAAGTWPTITKADLNSGRTWTINVQNVVYAYAASSTTTVVGLSDGSQLAIAQTLAGFITDMNTAWPGP